ncbi:hypothetical protein [Streptomyces sp. NPDC055287]
MDAEQCGTCPVTGRDGQFPCPHNGFPAFVQAAAEALDVGEAQERCGPATLRIRGQVGHVGLLVALLGPGQRSRV